jgi:hypothetical protein
MRVLIACEFSGIVRESFRARGHEAVSVDLLPSEQPGTHYQADVLDFIRITPYAFDPLVHWDMMIAFPPCTHLAVSGARWFKDKVVEQASAIQFVESLWNAGIPRIAIENPVGILSTRSILGKPTQIIQPWQFGHDASKATCLWLKGLPLLTATKEVDPIYGCKCGHRFALELGKYGCPNCNGDSGMARYIWGNQTPTGQNKLDPSPTRAADRARTYQGIADAMAEQWT